MLARREYSRAELCDRLLARAAPREEVDAALDELERRGFLSDARYAQALVAHKTGRFGRRAIAHELKEKRVDPEAAKDALAALADVDELAEATALWKRRFDKAPADEREKARQVRFLISRGYSMSVALRIVKGASGALDL
jgi:regulatory protein